MILEGGNPYFFLKFSIFFYIAGYPSQNLGNLSSARVLLINDRFPLWT